MAKVQSTVSEHARQAVEEVRDEIHSLGEHAQECMSDVGQAARRQASTLQRDIEARIVANPMKAVLIAAGVGVVFGCLLRR